MFVSPKRSVQIKARSKLAQALRVQIARQMQIEFKKQLARELAGIDERDREKLSSEIADYFGKVFDTEI